MAAISAFSSSFEDPNAVTSAFATDSLLSMLPDSTPLEDSKTMISAFSLTSILPAQVLSETSKASPLFPSQILSSPRSCKSSRWIQKKSIDNDYPQKIEALKRMDVNSLTDCLANKVFEDFHTWLSVILKHSKPPASGKIFGRSYFVYRYESEKTHGDLFGRAMQDTDFQLLRFNEELRSSTSMGDLEEKIYGKIQEKFLLKVQTLIDDWLQQQFLTDKISPVITFKNYSRILSEGRTVLSVAAYVPEKKPQQDDVSCFAPLVALFSAALRRP